METTSNFTEIELSGLLAVAEAHGIRTRARLTARKLKKAYDEAKSRLRGAESDARMFFMYDDCGSGYNAEHKQAQSAFEIMQAAFNDAVATEIESEKAYKKVRLTTIAQHPALRDVISRHIQRNTKS
jgi:hypothetical protein